MPYFVFHNKENQNDTIYQIFENNFDLDNSNIIKTDYKIIEDSQENFDLVKYDQKYPLKFNQNVITYVNKNENFLNKEQLKNYINILKQKILEFTNNNPNHPSLNIWNNYYNQLDSFNINEIIYPLNKSFTQYLKDSNLISLNILQIP
jgi:hypothetical protein